MTVKLAAGDAAPPFALLDQHGNELKLEDFKGRTLLLYFYPAADTPGCTTQSCSIRDAAPDLTSAGVEAVGISPDTPEDQLKFDQKYDLGFPLLSDPDHAVAEAYGAWGEQTYYGKTYEGIIRSSFLIDGDGRIIKSFYKVKPADTVPKAQAALAAAG
jgi:thioredoxin-dependent peroxiredoxin